MRPTRRRSVSLVTETGYSYERSVPSLVVVHSKVCGVRLEFVSEGGGLVCESVGKADLLSDHFGTKQSTEAVDLLLTYHLSPSFTTFAFRSSEVRRLL